jgi:hypothetical protein
MFLMILTIVGMSLVIFLTVISSIEEKQTMDAKARCESVGGKLGYQKCFKDGKEIKA